MTRVRMLITMTLAMVLLTGCEKYELDRRMEDLCKKDGGVRVYETVILPSEMFDQNGYPFPPNMRTDSPSKVTTSQVTQEAMLGGHYRFLSQITYLKRGDPVRGEGVLMRFSEQVIRVSDGKILGEAVSYGRSGGDFIAYAHFTSNHCPLKQGSNAATRAVFTKGN